MARCIVDKERCVEHAIERGGNGSCLKVRPDFEPILDEVMVARKRKSKIQIEVRLVRKRRPQTIAKIVMHEDRCLVCKHGITVIAVKRQDFRAIGLEDFHALDHRGRGIKLRITKTSLKGNVVNVLHVLEQLIFKALDHIIDRAVATIEG